MKEPAKREKNKEHEQAWDKLKFDSLPFNLSSTHQ